MEVWAPSHLYCTFFKKTGPLKSGWDPPSLIPTCKRWVYLSVTLFSVKINSITQCLKPGVDCSLYVDEFQICYRSSNMCIIERQLQLCLNKLQQWATDNGFLFSKTKTLCMHICQKRGINLHPQLFLVKSPIPVVEETKFLGVIFDRKLSFIPHLKYVKKKALKALNILKFIGNTEWGADRMVMLRLYRSLIRSKLDYGCIVYGSARKSFLQMLDPIHNQGLRLCLGAYRTSVESVYVDAHEPCLGARRAKLSLQYASKIKLLPKHHAHNAVFDNKYMKLFDARPNTIRTFGLRIKQFLTASKIELSDILETPSYFISPSWCMKPPKIVLELVHLKKYRTDASIYQQLFMEIRDRYRDHIPVYTDGSRDGNDVARSTVFPSNTVISMRLTVSASVFTAEVWAIIKALEQIKISSASKYIVFTDSLSCLQALHHMKLEHPLIGMVIRKCVFLNIAKKDIVFCWVPSHEKADSAAKSALCQGWCTIH